MLAMLLRTTMPSAPYDLSIWKSCVVATPLAFHTIQVSTVVAAHWMSPDAMARCRLACGIFLIVTSRPFFAKMPASLASVSGAKPVHPEIPIVTLVPCASAVSALKERVIATAATSAVALILVMFRSVRRLFVLVLSRKRLHDSCQHGGADESTSGRLIVCACPFGRRAIERGDRHVDLDDA